MAETTEFRVRVTYQRPISPATTKQQAKERIATALRKGIALLWPMLIVDAVTVSDGENE